jgi:hypothetical protein
MKQRPSVFLALQYLIEIHQYIVSHRITAFESDVRACVKITFTSWY